MDFDLNMARSLATVICFLLFVGIVVWVYAKRNRASFDEAAEIPFKSE